jgi:hypothetical protein
VSTSNTRTWQDNAAEFALLDKGEGWPFARLIACSVQKGSGQGARQPRNDRYEVGKVSAQEFARRAETSAPRVSRYLAAWDRAADQGLCTPSADLTPNDAPTVMEPDIAWSAVYAAGGRPRPRSSKADDAAKIIASQGAAEVVAAMTTRERDGMATELRRRQRADAEAVAEQMMQDELARGVDDREGAALRDSNEARLRLHQPLIGASYTLVQVRVAWREWHGLLSPADRATLPGILNEMEARLAALQLTITDDVVGEVLKHDEGR